MLSQLASKFDSPRKALWNSPCLLTFSLILLTAYQYYFVYLPLLSTVSSRLFFSIVSLPLLGMTLWSLPRAVFSDPGYLGADFHCPKERAQEVVNAKNLEHYRGNGLVDFESSNMTHKGGACSEGQETSIDGSQVDDTQYSFAGQNQSSQVLNFTVIEKRFNQLVRKYIKYTYCNKCQQYRPPRTHHCSKCNACVLRFDHHCPWTGNCIGIKNHKYFLVFLFWAGLTGLYSFVSFLALFQDTLLFKLVLWINFSGLGTFLILFCYHVKLIVHNSSSLEEPSLKYQNPFAVSHTDFPNIWQWYMENAELTLGRRSWRWFFPLEIRPEDLVYDGESTSLDPEAPSKQPQGVQSQL